MSLIRARDLSLEFGGNYILNAVNCSLEHNSRIGLIGTNGSGKTTLIKLFLGLLRPSSGEVLRARNCRVAWLPQDLKLDPNIMLLDHVHASRQDLIGLAGEIDSLSLELGRFHDSDTENRLNQCVERYTALGGYEFENESNMCSPRSACPLKPGTDPAAPSAAESRPAFAWQPSC